MSFQSVRNILEEKGLSFEDVAKKTKKEQAALLYEAFERDLSEGIEYVKDFVERFKKSGEGRFLFSEDPNSKLGRQLARLLGTDVCRLVLETHFGVRFGFYNCCNGVVAETKKNLKISLIEQIGFQSGNIPQLDC